MGLAVFGALCVDVLPDYFDATEAWRIGWALLGGLFGLIGLGGAATELSNLWHIKGFGDLAAAIILGGIAGGLHLIHDDVPAVLGFVARVAVVLMLLFSLVGTGLAIARIAAALPESVQRGQGRGGITFLSIATALIGLATAIVNFLNTNN